MSALVPVLAVTLAFVVVLSVAACARVDETKGLYGTPAATIEPNGPISWAEAQARNGERLTAEGPVASVQRVDGSVVLNLGVDAPDPSRLVVVIPASVVRKLKADPETAYANGLVRVTGMIQNRDAVATIVVAKLSDLKVTP